MSTDVASQLESALNQLMLPANRMPLCAPVISTAPPGIDDQTWPVLHTLGRIEPCTAARLAQEIGIDRSGASRHALALENLGFVTRAPSETDRRATQLSLTEAGRQTLDELTALLADHLHELLRSWPRGQAEALVDGLEQLIAYGRSTT